MAGEPVRSARFSSGGPEGRLAYGLFICLLAWTLRLVVVDVHRLHPDEALYGYWGSLVLSGRDLWLATVPVDKPPLLPYVLAVSLAGLGRSELAVRLPGLLSGLATVALSGRLARRLYGDPRVERVTMLVVALSPFTLLFSASGFTDPPMVVLGLAGCVAASENRPGWAGLWAGLALAAKQTGLLWLPLVILCVLVAAARTRPAGRRLPAWTALVRSWLIVLGLLWGWDRLRMAHGVASFWSTGTLGYGGLRLIWSTELLLRLHAWLGWLRDLLGSPLLDVTLVVGTAALLLRALRRRSTPALFDLALGGFCLAYLLLHWLLAFPVWDRYLLPLLPLLALLLGRVVALLGDGIVRFVPRRNAVLVNAALLLAVAAGLVPPAYRAVDRQIPVGAGLGAYDGIEQVVAFLRRQPPGSVLYHHWLGWAYDFYLFDGPLYLAYWPTPGWLARDVQAFGHAEPRLLVFPAWESSARVEVALAQVGYCLQPALEAWEGGQVRFRVYRVEICESPVTGCWLLVAGR